MQLYDELAQWWPLLSPIETYQEESVLYLSLMQGALGRPVDRLLELGSGQGGIAYHLPSNVTATLVDQSQAMLSMSERFNTRHHHICADMRTLTVDGPLFDAVLLHDAVMYLTTQADLLTTIQTVFALLRPGGVAVFVPDVLTDNFQPGHTLVGGFDTDTHSGRLTEWHWDPDPDDTQYQVEFAFMVREGLHVRCIHESHTMGLFSQAVWNRLLHEVGFLTLPAKVDPGFNIGTPILVRKPQKIGAGSPK